jgi:Transcriptional regulator, AbiEi antitoxin/Protein of unknown function (DUF559)
MKAQMVALPLEPFTSAEAEKLGISKRRLRELVEQRLIRRVLRGVYQAADVPDTMLNRAKAAALVVSPHAVVCDRTAAWLHGVDVFQFFELDALPRLEQFVLRDHSRVRREQTRGGERDLAPCDIMEIAGVKVTTPLRTALDLGCLLSRSEALAALDAFRRVHGLTREEMSSVLPRYFRRRGVRQLRELLPLADERAESPGESWTRRALVDANLPLPQLQWVIRTSSGRAMYRLDLAYTRARVCIEYDGEEFHTSPAQRRADERRRNWLRAHGWTVIVVTKEDLGSGSRHWVEDVRHALTAQRTRAAG